MSFALEFRKRHFAGACPAKGANRRVKQSRPAREAVDAAAETRVSRATMLVALVIAAAILAIFNSEGLRLYAGDLAEERFGRPLLTASEAWDGAMERIGAKRVEEGVRTIVAGLREARWTDLASAVGLAPRGAATVAGADEAAPGAGAPDITGSLPRPRRHVLDDGAESARVRFDRPATSAR
jgi:hypothetical protein